MFIKFLPALLLPVVLVGCDRQPQKREFTFYWETPGVPTEVTGKCYPLDDKAVPPFIVVEMPELNREWDREKASEAGTLSMNPVDVIGINKGGYGTVTGDISEEIVKCVYEYKGALFLNGNESNVYIFYNGRNGEAIMRTTGKEAIELNFTFEY